MKYLCVIVVVMALAVSVNSILGCDCSCYDGTHFNVYNASDANACYRSQSRTCPYSTISRSICTARSTPTPQPAPQPFCNCYCLDGTYFSVANAASSSSCYLKQYQVCPRSSIARSNCTTAAVRS